MSFKVRQRWLKASLNRFELVREWKNLFKLRYLREDIIAGITVACIAVPLSLAIALASGVPPGVGLVTAIVAGIICALFGGTPLSVSGPAAAMAVLVNVLVQKQGLDGLLIVGFGAGILQLLSGVLGLGKMVRHVPVPVVSGFTAGIGVIIFIGQIPAALGLPAPDQSNVISVLNHVGDWLPKTDLGSLILSAGTFILILGIPKISKKLPAPLIALVAMTALRGLLGLHVKSIGSISHSLPSPHLPSLPQSGWAYLMGSSVMFFFLASLQTLMSAASVDKMVKNGKKHNSNQELIGQGLGNMSVAMFGGIPVSGVIVRSALNIQAGGKTRRSAIFHSLVLLGIVSFFSSWIERIPVATLAGVLLAVSIRMVNLKELKGLWRVSRVEALVYVVTLTTMVMVDLLAGVQAGILVSLFILVFRLSQTKSYFHSSDQTSSVRFSISGPLSFISVGRFESIREEVKKVAGERGVILDMSRTSMIDATGAEVLMDLVEFILNEGHRVALQGLAPSQQKMLVASDPKGVVGKYFAATENDVQLLLEKKGSETPIDRLIFGVQRFRKDSHFHYQPLFDRLALEQSPHTLFITCSDSRINPNLITSTDPGELFIIRNVGNIIPEHGFDATPAEGAALEFAISVLGVKEIVVCGHSGCGAMKAITSRRSLDHLPELKKWLEQGVNPRFAGITSEDEAARINAMIQIEHLKTYPLVQDKLKKGEIRIHGWFYDIRSGSIEAWDEKTNSFKPVGESPRKKPEISIGV